MRLLTLLVPMLAVLSVPAVGIADENLVQNGSFGEAGEEAVPLWNVRRIARLTDFRVERGRLVAVRRAGGSPSYDAVLQLLYLPPDTRAIRVRLDAEMDRLIHAEVTVRFVRRDGGSAGGEKIFHLAGTRDRRTYDRDVMLPEATKDLEIAIRMFGEGRLVVDDVDVRPVDPARVRGQARVVELRGTWVARLRKGEVGSSEMDSVPIAIPVPPPTGTQCPVSLEIRVEPRGRLLSVEARRDTGLDALDLEIGPLPPGLDVKISLVARVVVTEREGFRELPEKIEISPARHLGLRLQAFAETGSAGRSDREDAERAAGGTTDLFELAEGVRNTVGGSGADRANRAALLYRLNEVPARAATLVRIGEPAPLDHCVVAYQKELGWLRFGIAPGGPVCLPFSDHVLLRAAPAKSPDPVQVELERIEGPSGGSRFAAREIGSLTLPAGAGPELIAGMTKAFDRACRKFDADTESFAVDPARISLPGRARKLKEQLVEVLTE